MMLKLLQVVEYNRNLENLSLANNILLEDQKTELTVQQIIEGKTEVELIPFNQ